MLYYTSKIEKRNMAVEIKDVTSEAVMVSSFLLAEIASTRFGQSVVNSIVVSGQTSGLIHEPDLGNLAENAARKQILMGYRGHYFNGFPEEIVWHRGQLKAMDIVELKTINFEYWLDFSDNTRRLTSVAKKIRENIQYKKESNDIFFQIARAQEEPTMTPVILVGEQLDSLTILEGHFRLVAFLLQEKQNQIIPAIIGLSDVISNWALY